MILIKESSDDPKGVKLHSKHQITLLVGSFDPFKGIFSDICDYIAKGVIWFTLPFNFKCTWIVRETWYIPNNAMMNIKINAIILGGGVNLEGKKRGHKFTTLPINSMNDFETLSIQTVYHELPKSENKE